MQRACVPPPLAFNASMVGPVIAAFGSPGAEGALPAEDREPRHLVVPGLLRARRRLRPRLAAHHGRPRRRRVRRQRPEDLDHARASTATGSSAWSAPTPTPKKQAGISFLLIDMTSPGVTVRPIELIDGGHEVNEVWFEDVRVPAENLVGEENKGWDYAKFLLGNERVGVAPVGATKRVLAAGQGATPVGTVGGGYAARRPADRGPDRRAGERAARPRADRAARGRALRRRQAAPGLLGAQAQGHRAAAGGQRAGRRPRRAARRWPPAPATTPTSPGWARRATPAYLNLRKASIYGGSNEIQRQIIAEHDPGTLRGD